MSSVLQDHRDVVVVWRVEQAKARYSWLRSAWSGKEDYLNASAERLSASVEAILQGVAKLDDQTALQMLVSYIYLMMILGDGYI